MLQDSLGRQFSYLRLSITDVCNFSCDYCLPDGYQCDGLRDFLSIAEINGLVSAFASLGTKKVRITGGEPCLRKDVSEVIALCKATPGIEQVAITTNGFNLDSKIDELVAAGLDSLNVSIDSLNPAIFKLITGHDKLRRILAGIDRAIALGVKSIKINAVLAKSFSDNHLEEFLSWVANKPVTVRFIELMETGDGKAFFEQNHLSGQVIKQQLLQSGWLQLVRGKQAGPAEEFFHPDYQGKIGLIMPYSKDFCRSCNRLRVSATGKLHLCLFAEHGIDLRPTLIANDLDSVQEAIERALFDKTAGHELWQRLTGATSHLAMLGG